MIKVFYDERQSVKTNSSFSPSAQKPQQVVQYWLKQKHPIHIDSFQPAQIEDLCLVHDSTYVTSVLNCTHPNGFGNTSPVVAAALPWVAGSMMNAALYSFKTKDSSFSPTSGAHHAGYSRGGGFCTFNHLALAAVKVTQVGAKSIGIIDLDCHYGDGTVEIINKLKLNYITHYSFGAHSPQKGTESDRWLSTLTARFVKMKACDLLIYNAGVDPHINDPLGGILSSEQMYTRDQIVYQFARDNNIPIVTSLAGGYQRDADGQITPVLKLHNQTMIAFREVYNR